MSREGDRSNRREEERTRPRNSVLEGSWTHHHGSPVIDVHGNTVSNALKRVEEFYSECRYNNERCFYVNTGQGHHSSDGVAHLRIAVIGLASRQGWKHKIADDNKGLVVVYL